MSDAYGKNIYIAKRFQRIKGLYYICTKMGNFAKKCIDDIHTQILLRNNIY